MRKIYIFSACILTLGAAVVVGVVFAQTFNRGGSRISAIQTFSSEGNTYAIDAKPPKAGRSPANANQYGNLSSTTPVLNYPASQAFSPPTAPNSGAYPAIVPTAPSWQPQTRTVWVPDPDTSGQYKPGGEQMYFSSPAPGQAGVVVPLDVENQQIANLLRELRADGETSPNPEKVQTLRKLVALQFDKRHKSQTARLEDIQADLQRTQEILVRRNGQRDEIIERRVAQLLGEQDPLQWDYQPAVPQLSAANYGYDLQRITPSIASPGLPKSPSPQAPNGLRKSTAVDPLLAEEKPKPAGSNEAEAAKSAVKQAETGLDELLELERFRLSPQEQLPDAQADVKSEADPSAADGAPASPVSEESSPSPEVQGDVRS